MAGGIKIPLRLNPFLKTQNFIKNDAIKRIRRKDEIKVVITNPKEGVNHERPSIALNLILSEKDVLDYLNKRSKVLSPIRDEGKVLAKTS